MKRYGNIYSNIYKMENLRLAHKRAKKDKSYYAEVKMIDSNEDYYLEQIQLILKEKTYHVSDDDYVMFEKSDKGKVRQIFKLDYFPHRIIQHALLILIEKILFKDLISNTFSSLPTRGIHKALSKLDYDLKNYSDETKYCLQMDIRKFYPSINHSINKEQYRRKFKDKDLLWLIDMLIDSLGEECGIAIGALFSQWDGNFNLSSFDHWIKEEVGVKFYYRYCDDLVILGNSKEYLHSVRKNIGIYLFDNLKLELKGNYKVYPVETQGIDFVGYRHFRNYILLRKSTSKTLVRKMRDIIAKIEKEEVFTYNDYCSINSYKGWLKWCNGNNLYNKWIKPLEPYKFQYYSAMVKNGKKEGMVLNKFSDFDKSIGIMVGDKIKIGEVLDEDIQVLSYKIGESKYKAKETLLTISIIFKNEQRIIFTGSKVLIQQCEEHKEQMPFEAKIKNIDKYYTFV